MSEATTKRHYPIGAEVIAENETHFRVWAPKPDKIEIALEKKGGQSFHSLLREEGGHDEADLRFMGDQSLRWDIGGGREIVLLRAKN